MLNQFYEGIGQLKKLKRTSFFAIVLALVLWFLILEMVESLMIKLSLTAVLLVLVGIRVYNLVQIKFFKKGNAVVR